MNHLLVIHRLIFVVLVAVCFDAASAQVLINEVMTSNQRSLLDEDGSHPDWIELYNVGSRGVDLAGLQLSDDPLEPDKWTIPWGFLGAGDRVVLYASGKDRTRAQFLTSVIDRGSVCHYFPGASEPPPGWNTLEFDPAAWASGSSGFGWGDDDDATTIPVASSVFVRSEFEIGDPSALSALYLHVDYDDGFVAYINGSEVGRAFISTPGQPPFDARVDSGHEASIYRGSWPSLRIVEDLQTLLRPGTNVLAVQCHTLDADDLSLTPILTLGYDVEPQGGAGPVSPYITAVLPKRHTNFKLSAGEEVVLSDPGGVVLDTVVLPQLPFDVSYGREVDGATSFVVFAEPTPWDANGGGETATAYAEPPAASPAPGFYDGSVTMSLLPASPLSTLHYTLDGSDPTSSSPVYAGPLVVSQSAVVRAIAVEPGSWPSVPRSFSYFIGEPTTLPVVSLSTDPTHFFDGEEGIYVLGDDYSPEHPFFGANFWKDWERPIHVEFFEADRTPGFAMNAGVVVHGGFSRGFAQKSLRIIPRGGYGRSTIDYPLFPDKSIEQFGAVLLRNGGNDWDRGFFRDGIVHRVLSGTSLGHQAFRPVTVFLNGEYWGIHNLRERQDADYLAANYDVDADAVDFLERWGLRREGSADHYLDLLDYVRNADLSQTVHYDYVCTQMDVDNYALYTAIEVFFGNNDWPENNVRMWRPQTPDGRWQWLFYDIDSGLGAWSSPTQNSLAEALDPDDVWDGPFSGWATVLFRSLTANEAFRRSFINRYADLMNTLLAPEHLAQVHASTRTPFDAEMPRHVARWPLDLGRWQREQDEVADFLATRRPAARQHVIEEFGLSGTYQLGLDVSPAGSGSIELLAARASEAWSGTYFAGNPVTVTAAAAAGFAFSGWSDSSLPQTATIEIDPGGDTNLTALFTPIAASVVVINEINYNSPDDADAGDWLELHNTGTAAVEIGGWEVRDGSPSNVFSFPQRTLLPAGGFTVVCRDTSLFRTVHPSVPVHGELGFGLSGSGELVRLYDDSGALLDSLTYDDAPPWPTAPDGNGATLELIDATLDNALAGSWAGSTAADGTPGRINSVTPDEPQGGPAPSVLRIGPVAPNPFRPTTRIDYTVPVTGRVTIDIYDVMGRHVVRLIDAVVDLGTHSVTWDATGRSSGVYYAQLSIGSDRLSRKLVLLN